VRAIIVAAAELAVIMHAMWVGGTFAAAIRTQPRGGLARTHGGGTASCSEFMHDKREPMAAQ